MRWIPVKSNLTYELYQSQCIGPNGLVEHPNTFASHPYTAPGPERTEYNNIGEMAYLDRKRDLFGQAVLKGPLELGVRMANRFLAATLWYVPFDRAEEAKIIGWTWLRRLMHPWPFLAVLFLLGTAQCHRLHPAQWVVIGLYGLYLLPYVLISYYDRYAAPLLGVKVLLIIFAADRCLSWLFTETAVVKEPTASPQTSPQISHIGQPIKVSVDAVLPAIGGID